MAGNIFGVLFKITTFGESHGPGVGVVIDGCPAGIALSSDDFNHEMARRRPGTLPYSSSRKETDSVQILSGVFEGLTTGAPICLYIQNRDADSRTYQTLRKLFRPGHGDYTYYQKYHYFDYRGGGRYSARETAPRVAAGVVAQKILDPSNIKVMGYTVELGGIKAKVSDLEFAKTNPLQCPDPKASALMADKLEQTRKHGDTLGGIVEVLVKGCPAGLGEPVFDKLDADLAKAVMSIGTVKGVETGAGFAAARLTGSQNNDPIQPNGFKTNNAGGILAGISNGEDIIIRAAIKPIPSIRKEQQTIDREGNPATISISGRHDVCAIPRIVPVLEAMVKITMADHLLRAKAVRRGGNGPR